MKRILFVLTVFSILNFGAGVTSHAESKKELRSTLKEKADKAARKEAKKVEKEGWHAFPGSLPIEKQLDRSYLMEYDIDEYGQQKFIFGMGLSTSNNLDAAKIQALEMAKIDLVNNIKSHVGNKAENDININQIGAQDFSSIKTDMSAVSKAIETLGRYIRVIEWYRETGVKKEVRIRLALSTAEIDRIKHEQTDKALESKRKELREELKTEMEQEQ